jgi:formate/nitrite transporter FocA (FNT family)
MSADLRGRNDRKRVESTPAPPEERTDEVLDHEPQQIVERAADVGEHRLDRTRFDAFITGIIGGVEVSLGALAAMCVVGSLGEALPGMPLYARLAVGGLVFPIGFLFVIMGRSELFTENFLIPVVAVLSRERSVVSLLRIWVMSWAGNVVGCAAIAALLSVPHAIGDPIVAGYRDYTAYKLAVPGLGTFVSAILAGLVMTVLTWLMVAIRHPVAKAVAIFAAGYVIFASNVSHAIVGAAILFAGFMHAHHTATDVAGWLGLATAGNLVGGIAFVTMFRIAQAREKERSS